MKPRHCGGAGLDAIEILLILGAKEGGPLVGEWGPWGGYTPSTYGSGYGYMTRESLLRCSRGHQLYYFLTKNDMNGDEYIELSLECDTCTETEEGWSVFKDEDGDYINLIWEKAIKILEGAKP